MAMPAEMSDATGVAAPMASTPTYATSTEQETTIMARTPDAEEVAGRYPVDPTGPLTIGSIPEDDLADLIAGIPGDDDQADDAASGTCGYWPIDPEPADDQDTPGAPSHGVVSE